MSAVPGVIGVFGATGFIGRRLCEVLQAEGGTVVRFSRNPSREDGEWRLAEESLDLSGLDAVVNLAGESIAKRWTRSAWEQIVDSRIGLTNRIVAALARMPVEARPRILVNASATGYYPSSGDRELDESEPAGAGPMAELCRDWEAAAVEAEPLGTRVVRLRTGIVLGAGGDAWERLRKLFSLGLGGRLGPGTQWMPWIHLEDEAAAIAYALRSEGLAGPLNLTAPEPVLNREFTRLLAAQLGRPAFFHAPGFALRLALGEFSESLLASHRVIPRRLLDAGFNFRFPNLEAALGDLCE